MKFLTISPELKAAGYEWGNIHASHEYAFRVACKRGYIDILNQQQEDSMVVV